MILVVQLDQGGMAAQGMPYLIGDRIANGCVRKSQNVGRSDDMNLARVKHLPEGAQRALARAADSGRVRDQVEASPGTGYADIEHAQPAGFPGIPVQIALGHPAQARSGPRPSSTRSKITVSNSRPWNRWDVPTSICGLAPDSFRTSWIS